MRTNPRAALLLIPATIAVLAACGGSKGKSGTPIVGVLSDAQGVSAPLTLQQTVFGSGFAMHAVLGSAGIVGSGNWQCYAPDATHPNYDLVGSDNQTFGLFFSIQPSAWTVGSHPIDGTAVQLLVASPDRFGVSTNGTLVITTAGLAIDTTGSTCGWYTSGATPLFGRLNN